MSATKGAEALEATRRLFAHFPDAPLDIDDRGTSIELKPKGEGTVAVTVYDQGDDTMIAAGRWHTHYDDPEQLAWCALWLLTPFYRLVEEYKGGVLVALWVERYEGDEWIGADPVFYLNPEHRESWEPVGDETFARRYFQQRVVELPMPYTQFDPEAQLDAEGLPPESHFGMRVVQARASEALSLV